MTSKLTREQLHERARENVKALKMASRQTAFESAREEILADLQLAELALAAMDSEPVAWTWHYREKWHVTNDERRAEFVATDDDVAVLPLYRHSQPAPERDQVRREHAEWSQATFGDVGPIGPLKHLSKEALEAAADPHDPLEWADMQFLLWDAQRRMGISDEFITRAMVEKLAINKARQWPEPKDGEPRLHIKEQPAPVVSADLLYTAASAIEDLLEHTDPNTSYYSGVWADVPGKLRAAMLQAKSLTSINPAPALGSLPKTGEVLHTSSPVNDVTAGKPLTIILPDISSKAFWSGSGKTEVFHPETYRRWVKEAIERGCIIACIDVEVN